MNIKLILLEVILLAGTSGKFPTCGGNHGTDDCRCARRVYAIQERALAACSKSNTSSRECLLAVPWYCDIIAQDSGPHEGEDDKVYDEAMSSHCTGACKMHDCKCGHNHETCHIDHKASDHRSK